MLDNSHRRDPANRLEWWVAGIFLAVMFGLFALEVYSDYTPIKLSVLLVLVFWVPLLALHEAGHAIAAHLLGWHVGQVVIGMGKVMGRFRIGSASVEIRLVPIEGFVKCVPTRLRLPQVESALIYFAGPGVELLLAAGILLLTGPDRLFTITDDYWLILWQSLALAAVSQGIMNLIPFGVRSEGGDMASDGLGIVLSLLRPTRYYAGLIGWKHQDVALDADAHDQADWWKR